MLDQYISPRQLQVLLQNDLFTAPITEITKRYVLYRNRWQHVEVYTVRFNLIEGYSQEFMLQELWRRLFQRYFRKRKTVQAAIDYDILLVKEHVDGRRSYYIWRANVNRHDYYSDYEIEMNLSFQHCSQLVAQANRFDLSSLNLYFNASDVKIDSILAIVCNFSALRVHS